MKRGVGLVIFLLVLALVSRQSALVAALSRRARRASKVPERSTLVLRPGGELFEIVPGRRAAVRRPIATRGPCAATSRRCARRRSTSASPRCCSRRAPFSSPFWAQGAGAARGGRRFQDLGQAGLRVSRVRRRSRVLPRHRGRQDLPGADRDARPHRRRDLRGVPARHARLGRHLSRSAAHRRLQDRHQHLHREDLHARAQGDERRRSIAISSSSWCARSPTAGARRKPRSARRSTKGRCCPKTRCGTASSTISRTKTSSTISSRGSAAPASCS